MSDSIFDTEILTPPGLDLRNTSIKIGADCCRQLIDVLERVRSVGCNCIPREYQEDAEMAISEARQWLGDEPDCEDGACRL